MTAQRGRHVRRNRLARPIIIAATVAWVLASLAAGVGIALTTI